VAGKFPAPVVPMARDDEGPRTCLEASCVQTTDRCRRCRRRGASLPHCVSDHDTRFPGSNHRPGRSNWQADLAHSPSSTSRGHRGGLRAGGSATVSRRRQVVPRDCIQLAHRWVTGQILADPAGRAALLWSVSFRSEGRRPVFREVLGALVAAAVGISLVIACNLILLVLAVWRWLRPGR